VKLRHRVAELETADAERKRVEEALQENKRQMESLERFITSILDSIPTSLVTIDRSQRVVSARR
jgi:nitrogen fixation/metabolism regulation signal transduction histidine kinase